MAYPRNLLVVLCDQLRRDALGCYGDSNAETPNLDAMAGRGVRFDNACSTYPICVPFRFSMMTGHYAHTRMVPGIQWRMSPAERTLADELNEAGLESIYVGKWHLFGDPMHMGGYSARQQNRRPVPPRFQGRWRHWRGFELRNSPFDTCYFVDDDPTPRPIEGYQTDGLFDLAMEQMRAQHDAGAAFGCVLSVEPPHPPYEAPPELEAKWGERELALPPNFAPSSDEQREKWLARRRTYYAMLENLDRNMGRLRAFLEETGLARDTAVVFLSDHGELDGSHGLLNKQHPYEESVGIPLIVEDPTAPGSAGRVVEAPVATEDLFPTWLGLLGRAPAHTLPGTDASALVRDPQATLEREGVLLAFVSELRPNQPYHQQVWRGFRTARHKYTVLGDLRGAAPWQLFDLEQDPYEMNNLIEGPAHAETAQALHTALRARMAETDDDCPLAPAFGVEGLNLHA
jgi:arylsulfatase A-like enzyme